MLAPICPKKRMNKNSDRTRRIPVTRATRMHMVCSGRGQYTNRHSGLMDLAANERISKAGLPFYRRRCAEQRPPRAQAVSE
jgi:hypothetical protein